MNKNSKNIYKLTNMPVEILKCADELHQYINELPMPKGLNGKEQNNIIGFIQMKSSSKLKTAMEVYRRMQDLHDAINSGRLFLCLSQRSEYPELYKEPTPEWAASWVQSRFIESSIQAYNSAFDLYLQINWLYFELYKDKYEFSQETLQKIFTACRIDKILKEHNKLIIGETIYKGICTFKETNCYKEILFLCSAMKHRQRIDFDELSQGKHPLYINIEGYDSQESLLIRSIPNVISSLKEFHKALSNLCEESLPFWSFESEEIEL